MDLDLKYNSMILYLNTEFDERDDYLLADLVAIKDHKFLSRILELKVNYSNGGQLWHPLDLVKDDYPNATADYIVFNDLVPISNGTHRCWARVFKIFLKRTMHMLRRYDLFSFTSSTFEPVPPKKS